MELSQLKNDLSNRFDSLDIMMRGIEVDSDEEMKGHEMGRVTYGSILENIPMYVQVAQNTGMFSAHPPAGAGLSENLQRKLHEVVTELFLIVTRAQGTEFEVEDLRDDINDVITKVPTLAQAHQKIKSQRDFYAKLALAGVPQGDTPDEQREIDEALYAGVLQVLASALVIEDELVTIELEDQMV